MKISHRALKSMLSSVTAVLLVVLSLYFLNYLSVQKKSGISKKTNFDLVKHRKDKKVEKKKVAKQEKQKDMKKVKPILDLNLDMAGADLGIDVFGLGMRDSKLLSNTDGTAMTEDVVDKPPVATHREPAAYPAEAIDKKINGFVLVQILVNESGHVGKVKILDSSPVGLFDQSALQAVKSWLFQPAEYKGRLVSVWLKQKIQFKMN